MKPAGVATAEIPALRATEVARVPSVTYGPYLGMREDGALVLWAPQEGNGRRFKGVLLDGRGVPKGEAFGIGAAPEQPGLVAVRALGDGYAVVYTRRSASGAGELLEVSCVDARGVPLAEAAVFASIAGSALWVEAVPTAVGALVFHAARSADKRRAEIWATVLDGKCHAAQKAMIARDALAWQAVKRGAGAAVAVVQAMGGAPGTASVVQVDATARVLRTTVVSAPASADLDLDAVSVGESVLLAWSDRRGLDPRVVSALVDGNGKLVAAPEPLTSPDGEQALVRLVPPAPGGPVYAVWERIALLPEAERHIALAALGPEGRVTGPVVELEYSSQDGGVPEFAAAPDGLSALTLASACRVGQACDPAGPGPLYVRLDAGLNPTATEPLRLAPLRGARAELGFGLGCTRDGCFAISALAQAPAPVFATELEARSNAWRPPIRQLASEVTPRVLEHASVSAPESIAAFALDTAGGRDPRDYLAYVTDFDPSTPWSKLSKPAPDGRYEPVRARVVLERLTKTGPKLSEAAPASPISLRAQSVGGVALAHGDPKKDELLLAWAGFDAGVPQVFLSQIGRGGLKLSQRMLTRKKGDLGDIAAAWVGDGWVVAWVDERAGDPEIFATKLDSRLARIGPEQRLTHVAGTASDLSLVFDGKALRLAWSDARVAELPGQADVYSVLLNPRDASRDGDEQCVAETPARSFGPRLAPYEGGFALAWIELGEEGQPGAGAVAVATFGADGSLGPVQQPFPVGSGEPRALGIECVGPSCHLAVVVEDKEKEQVALVGANWAASGPGNSAPLLPIAGSAAAAVSPVFFREDLLFVDSGKDGTRLRRARVKW